VGGIRDSEGDRSFISTANSRHTFWYFFSLWAQVSERSGKGREEEGRG
jgi:hypothetical protein